MQAGGLRRCTHLDVLTGIGRNLLARFLASFAGDLAAQNLTLPNPETPDPDYFQAAATLLADPERLPPPLLEALSAIEELSDPLCRDQTISALAESGLIIVGSPRPVGRGEGRPALRSAFDEGGGEGGFDSCLVQPVSLFKGCRDQPSVNP